MWPVLLDLPYLKIYSYPLFMGMAWGLCYYGSLALFEKHRLSTRGLRPFFWGNFLASWIGAKVLFLITYLPGQSSLTSLEALLATNFWLGGGFVFYGGLLFGLIFTLFYTLKFKKFSFDSLPYLLPFVAYSHALGRIGCLMAGCCFGAPSKGPLAFTLQGQPRHPVQLYEAIGLLVLGFILHKKLGQKSSYTSLATYLLGYCFLRFFLEFYRADQIRGVWGIFSTSQWIACFLSLITVLSMSLKPKT